MSSDWKGLAARFRTSLDEAAEASARVDEERLERLEEGRAARAALLAELRDFGQALGHILVDEDAGSVSWSWRERTVRFEPMGDGDRLRVSGDAVGGQAVRIYRLAEFQDRWILGVQKKPHDDLVPLWDAGVSRLLVKGLGLPDPSETPSTSAAEASEEAAAEGEPATSDPAGGRGRTL